MSVKINVLFVCLGNICRSPTAQGFFQQLIYQEGLEKYFNIDSAGTSSYHIGEAPDQRSIQAAKVQGVDISSLRARQFCAEDFTRFDYLIAMDRENVRNIKLLQPRSSNVNPQLFLEYARNTEISEVPDPYLGGIEGFEEVITLIQSASEGLLKSIVEKTSELRHQVK